MKNNVKDLRLKSLPLISLKSTCVQVLLVAAFSQATGCGNKSSGLGGVVKSSPVSAPAEMRTDLVHPLHFELKGQGNVPLTPVSALYSNAPTQAFDTKIVTDRSTGTDFTRFAKKLRTRIEVRSPGGTEGPVLFSEGQSGTWQIPTNQGDGRYTVVVSLEPNANLRVYKEPPPVEFYYDIDTSPPEILVTGQLEADTGAMRKVNLSVTVTNKRPGKVSCEKVVLSYPQITKTDSVGLTAVASSIGDTTANQVFSASNALIAAEKSVGAFATVRCVDVLGNAAETSVPVLTKGAKLGWSAQLSGKTLGTLGPDPLAPAEKVLHAHAGALEVQGKIFDLNTQQPVDPKFIELEQERLKVYVTDFKPSDIQKLRGASTYATGAYKTFFGVPLPVTFTGRQSLFATLTAMDYENGLEYIVGTQTFDFYVDNDAGSARWLSPVRFVQAKKGAALKLQASVQSKGSGLVNDGWPYLEYSTDNVTWQNVADAKWSQVLSAVDKRSEVNFTYSFDTEKPFRVRMRMLDFAGNEFLSALSPQMVGAADFDGKTLWKLSGANACLRSDSTPAARLGAAAVSRVMCRKKLVDGTLLDGYFVQVLFNNRGEGAFDFYSNASTVEKLGYWVTLDGETKPEGKRSIQPVDAFKRLQAQQIILRSIEVNKDLKSAAKVTVQFGVEGTGASSFKDNTTCEAPGNFAQIVLQDLAGPEGALIEGPFPCDDEATL